VVRPIGRKGKNMDIKKFEVGKKYGDHCYIAYRIDKRTEKTLTYTEIHKPGTPYEYTGETKKVKIRSWGRNKELEAFFGRTDETIQSNEEI
jgi:hypothetical protein